MHAAQYNTPRLDRGAITRTTRGGLSGAAPVPGTDLRSGRASTQLRLTLSQRFALTPRRQTQLSCQKSVNEFRQGVPCINSVNPSIFASPKHNATASALWQPLPVTGQLRWICNHDNIDKNDEWAWLF